MDLANRFVIILLALLLVFAAAVVVLLTWAAGPDSVEQLARFVQYLNDHVEDDGAKVIVSLGALVVALLALLIVFIELAPPEASAVPVRDVKAGNAVLTTDAVARRVQEEVARVPQVVQTKASVAARGKGVEVSLELQVDPEANLAAASEAACQVVQEVVTNQLGVEMARLPRVRLHFTERPRQAVAVAAGSTEGSSPSTTTGAPTPGESASETPQAG